MASQSHHRHLAAGAVEAQGEAAAVVDQIERVGSSYALEGGGPAGVFLMRRAEAEFVTDAVFGAHQFARPPAGLQDFGIDGRGGDA